MVHPSGEQPTVLIVEDEAIVAEDLSYKVKALGYQVFGVFSTGEQAIIAAQQRSIDLVLIDIQLRGSLDGIETAEQLQQVCDPAIVFTTAHSDPETVKKANATDPHGYILKPFGERDLAVQLAIALHKHRADRALRKAEEHIRQKEAELEVIVSRTPFLLTRCNRDLRYQFVSRAYAAMLGRSAEDIAGKPIVDIMGNRGFQTILPYIARVLNGESVTFETEVEFKNIGKRWLEVHYWPDTDVRGNVVGWIASILDMTERKNAEKAVEMIALFPAQNPSPVLRIDPAGVLLYMNPASDRLLDGLHLQVGQSVPADLRDLVEQTLQSGRSEKVEYDIGSCHYLVCVTPLLKEHYANLYWTDITERKQVEEALRKSEERLQLAQERLKRWNLELEEAVTIKTAELVQSQERLRALATEINLAEQRERQRLATELHDHLQQLLVLGKLHLGQGKQHAAGIPACAAVMKQVDGLLGDALQYTRTLVAELSPSVLRDHGLAAGLKWLGEYMKKYDMAVTVTVPETEVALPKDQVVLLFQSVRELLINSWKHAGSAAARVSLSQQNAMLSITVSDQGKGFDLAAAAAAAAADTPNGGLSSKFGLFNVSERMKALGGSFDIQSSPNRGTTIILTLPLSPWPEKKSAEFVASRKQNEPPSEECSTTHRSARIRVVLVDDHIMVRQGLKVVLESYPDIELVGEAADGEEAVAVVSRLQPDVVVMDINMPRKNGIDATRAMKARHPGITVIGISVNTTHGDEQAMLKAGAIRLLNKESAVEHLHKAIREATKDQAVLSLSNASTATILLIDGHKQDREYWAERLRISSPDFVVLEADTGGTALEICNTHRVDCVVVEAELPDMSGFKVLLKSIGDAAPQEKAVIVLSRLNLESLRELAMKHGAFAYLMKSQVSGDDLDRTIRKALASVGSTQKERVS